jgi:hypothetical protein
MSRRRSSRHRLSTAASTLAVSAALGACVVPATGPAYQQPTPPGAVDPGSPAEAPPGPVVAGDPDALPFAEGTWNILDNGAARPRVVDDGRTLELIADEVYSAAAIAWLAGEVRPPYSVELDYATWDDDGGPLYSSGDGIAVLLLDDEAPYARHRPPGGGDRGVIRDGTGYSVQLPIYGDRRVAIHDGNGGVLASRPEPATFTGGRFAHLRIDVDHDGIAVSVDGQAPVVWRGAVDDRFGGLAIAAATGAADGGHAVRDVRLIRPAMSDDDRDDRPERDDRPDRDRPRRRDLIVNGSFEAPAIGDGSWATVRDLPGWRTVGGPGIEIQRHVAGEPADGDQHVELDSDGPSAMVQDLATEPGARYRLRFRVAARPGTHPDDNRLEVRWNGAVVDVATATPTGNDTRWERREVIVQAGTARSTLELRDASPANGTGIYVDEVTLVRTRR